MATTLFKALYIRSPGLDHSRLFVNLLETELVPQLLANCSLSNSSGFGQIHNDTFSNLFRDLVISSHSDHKLEDVIYSGKPSERGRSKTYGGYEKPV